MFKKIFFFELDSWFNKPAFYLFAFLSAGLGALTMATAAGAFDANTATVTSLKYVNSPNGLLLALTGTAVYIFLLFPSIMGAAIHKDFKHNVHKVMFSFPFDKSSYFWGKFLSSFTICMLMILFIGVGVYAGTLLPSVNTEIIGPQDIMNYIQVYTLYLIPGAFLFAAIVFSTVTFSRSVVAAFIVMIAIYVFQGILEQAMNSFEWEKTAALLDPFGMSANLYYTKYWTIVEENTSKLPFTGLVIWNRLLWMLVGVAILSLSYVSFDFKVNLEGWKLFRRKANFSHSDTYTIASGQKLHVPKVDLQYGFLQNLNSAWQLMKIDLRYILTGGPFIVITVLGLLFILIMFMVSSIMMETPTLPTTKEMLSRAGQIFFIFILLLTIVYTGLIINRKSNDHIYQLEDVTPTKDWSFVLSKLGSITAMQAILLLIPIIAGITYQIYNGYYQFEISVYLRDLYTIKWLQLIPITLLAILFYSLIPNYYIGLVLCLIFTIGWGFVDQLGIEQNLYKFNRGQGVGYSDISGYGWYIKAFYIYRLYWIVGGLFFTIIGWFIWRRGNPTSFLKRLKSTSKKTNSKSVLIAVFTLMVFFVIGRYIYYQTNVMDEYVGSKERERRQGEYESKYKSFEKIVQPRIVDINLNVELYPSKRDFYTEGYYWLKNKSKESIDTLIVLYSEIKPEVSLSRQSELLFFDSINNILAFSFVQSILPGDSLQMNFVVKNKPNTLFSKNAPIRKNGTFFNNSVFPYIGYQDVLELSETNTRKKYGLDEKERMRPHSDTAAYQNTYISNCADWVDFEIKIGTSKDQIAIAPGNLLKEWEENDRKYFHYKMKRPMMNFYNICSARYEIKKDKWNDVDIAIYYHKMHDFNIDRMISGLKDGFDYFTSNFSPYQHDQVRILEVPRVSFAQSFANTIPFSENVGFVAMPDDSEKGGVDFTYAITAHELAHQWWAHQVIGANVKGSTMLSESLSEYSSLKVLEKKYGKTKMRKFLKDALDKYLQFRSTERKKELPLAYNENQAYIHYQKGSLAFYALSDYIGETQLNKILSEYIDSVGFQEPPYTTSLELLEMLKHGTPDSLLYFITDMFEHITLYDNRIESTSYTENEDGTYTVDITAHISKYRTDERGRQQFEDENGVSLEVDGRSIKSYPLQDYVDVGIFGMEEEGDEIETELYLKKHKITEIENHFTITVDKLPKEVGIDPYNKLIDRNSEDNRRRVSSI